ncbi:MAG: hypothetical protein U9P90_01555 [Patescibacteria group bacterium]|nr:hypothetical protein [Patescibacteria group bacterium]
MVKNTDGNIVSVSPSETVETYFDQSSLSDLTETLASPYYNPVLATTYLSGASTGEVALNALTDELEIYNKSSATISVFLTAGANNPIVVPANASRAIDDIKNKSVGNVLFQFSSTVASGELFITEKR